MFRKSYEIQDLGIAFFSYKKICTHAPDVANRSNLLLHSFKMEFQRGRVNQDPDLNGRVE